MAYSRPKRVFRVDLEKKQSAKIFSLTAWPDASISRPTFWHPLGRMIAVVAHGWEQEERWQLNSGDPDSPPFLKEGIERWTPDEPRSL